MLRSRHLIGRNACEVAVVTRRHVRYAQNAGKVVEGAHVDAKRFPWNRMPIFAPTQHQWGIAFANHALQPRSHALAQ